MIHSQHKKGSMYVNCYGTVGPEYEVAIAKLYFIQRLQKQSLQPNEVVPVSIETMCALAVPFAVP